MRKENVLTSPDMFASLPDSTMNLKNMQGNPSATSGGIRFNFNNNNLNGKLYFGLIREIYLIMKILTPYLLQWLKIGETTYWTKFQSYLSYLSSLQIFQDSLDAK